MLFLHWDDLSVSFLFAPAIFSQVSQKTNGTCYASDGGICLFYFSTHVFRYFFVPIWSFSSYVHLAVSLFLISLSLYFTLSPPSCFSDAAFEVTLVLSASCICCSYSLAHYCPINLSFLPSPQGISLHPLDEVKFICWVLPKPSYPPFVLLSAFVKTEHKSRGHSCLFQGCILSA